MPARPAAAVAAGRAKVRAASAVQKLNQAARDEAETPDPEAG
jgi:hypothetical protein